jgi:hypothetical protein
MAIRNAITSAIEAGAAPGEIEMMIEAVATAGAAARQMALPFTDGIEAAAGDGRGDAGTAAAAPPPVVIPSGQGELF